ncbi:MAG: hypothetical protein IIC33_07265 [Chloroflexi bacterium]|nr:hypothetical protein [Chloroflexota bacterium]
MKSKIRKLRVDVMIWTTRIIDSARGSAGSILLETVVAVMVFGLVGTAVMGGLGTVNISGAKTESQSIAENIARNQMEYLFSQPYREPQQTPYPNISVPTGYSVSTTLDFANTVNPDPEIEKITATVSHDAQIILTLETVRGRKDGLRLKVSTSNDRSNSIRLAGETIVGTVYVFLDDPELQGDNQTKFYLDGAGPLQTEGFIPWDFKGGGVAIADPWDTASDAAAWNGAHRITARILLKDGNTVNVTADFTINN